MGGKRKKSNNGPIKKESKYKIPARFDCPICDTKSSIAVKISRAEGSAEVYCRSCQVGKGRKWSIRQLEKGVDVFFRFREELTRLDKEYLEEKRAQPTAYTANPYENGGHAADPSMFSTDMYSTLLTEHLNTGDERVPRAPNDTNRTESATGEVQPTRVNATATDHKSTSSQPVVVSLPKGVGLSFFTKNNNTTSSNNNNNRNSAAMGLSGRNNNNNNNIVDADEIIEATSHYLNQGNDYPEEEDNNNNAFDDEYGDMFA